MVLTVVREQRCGDRERQRPHRHRVRERQERIVENNIKKVILGFKD